MERFVIDNCAVHRIVCDSELALLFKKAVLSELIKVISVDELEDEYSHPNTPEEIKSFLNEIPRKIVPAEAFVWGQRWGAKWGDGSHTGIADVLVTADTRFAKRVKSSSAKCAVWDVRELLNYLKS